jgi:hypothetical protein
MLVCRADAGVLNWCWCAELLLVCRTGGGVSNWCWCAELVLVCRTDVGVPKTLNLHLTFVLNSFLFLTFKFVSFDLGCTNSCSTLKWTRGFVPVSGSRDIVFWIVTKLWVDHSALQGIFLFSVTSRPTLVHPSTFLKGTGDCFFGCKAIGA